MHQNNPAGCFVGGPFAAGPFVSRTFRRWTFCRSYRRRSPCPTAGTAGSSQLPSKYRSCHSRPSHLLHSWLRPLWVDPLALASLWLGNGHDVKITMLVDAWWRRKSCIKLYNFFKQACLTCTFHNSGPFGILFHATYSS